MSLLKIKPQPVISVLLINTALILFISSCNFTDSSSQSNVSQTQQPQTFVNGDFETGNLSPWVINGPEDGIEIIMEGDNHIAHFKGNSAIRQAVSIEEGKNYTFQGQFRCHAFAGGPWGDIIFKVINPQPQPWETIVSKKSAELLSFCGDGEWHDIAINVVAPFTGEIYLEVGAFGKHEQVDFLFDNLSFAPVHTEPKPPTSNPQTDISSGQVPLTVAFTANAQDVDGVVDHYVWRFGDGTEARIANPQHTFYQRGRYEVELIVWDNSGYQTSNTVLVTVTDATAPTITINSPISTTTIETLSLQGSLQPAEETNRPLVSLVWDNLNTGEVGSVVPNANWEIEAIPLKPGLNELLLTAIDEANQVGTTNLKIYRTLTQPIITDITPLTPETIGLYEPYEVQFAVETVADNPFFQYDDAPPPGVQPGIGVTVEGIITTPTGETLQQPAFFMTEVFTMGSRYIETPEKQWRLRITPQLIGTYHLALQITDDSGSTMVEVGQFEVVESDHKGFIQVSRQDSRYFEYSNGDLFFPVGPAINSDYRLNQNALNFERPWLAGLGIYSTNWARWISSSEKHGNEGFMAPLTFTQHYPSHELSYKLFCSASCGDDETDMDGWWMWMGYLDERFGASLDVGKTYRLKTRLKMVNLTPKLDGDYGLTAKFHGWRNDDLTWKQYLDGLPVDNTLLNPLQGTSGWHTRVTTFTLAAKGEYISLYLDNVKTGQVYIDALSIQEINQQGEVISGEMIRHPRADMHTYMEQRPSAYLDWQVKQGEKYNTYFKYVVQDKNDWIPNHLNQYGFFHDVGQGYYQPNGTKARWLQQQWWRYIIARWGYSPAIHSWELNNEGDPTDASHYKAAQEFAEFMHLNDSHPHLATTSFWCCWSPQFWADSETYPNVDYADLHEYSDNANLGDKQVALEQDLVALHLELSQKIKDNPVGKPVMRAESGITLASENAQLLGKTPNPGIWYHNLLWSQLDYSGVTDVNYWFTEHFRQVDLHYHGEKGRGESRAIISQPFFMFVQRLDLNKGGYTEAETMRDNGNLRILGQSNLDSGKAHLWIQNKHHTWYNVLTNPSAILPQTAVISLKMQPQTEYQVTWWDTYQGSRQATERLSSNQDGWLNLTVDELETDTAVILEPAE